MLPIGRQAAFLRSSALLRSSQNLASRSFAVEVHRLTATPADTSPGPVLGGDEAKIISGSPTTKTAVQYSGELLSGTWECEPGKWNHTQSGDEHVALLMGEMVLTSEAGTSETYAAPDNFVIPDGWTGTWEVISPLKKFFVVRGE